MKKGYDVQLYVDEDSRSFIKNFGGLVGCEAIPQKDLVDGENVIVKFVIDRDKISRGAGRKPKDVPFHKVGEVYRYRHMEDHTPEETAVWCGLSLRTYQRWVERLKYFGAWKADSEEPFTLPKKV